MQYTKRRRKRRRMKMSVDFWRAIEQIIQKDKRYKKEAYAFVMAALDFTLAKLDKPRHVTGQELLDGIREYGMEQFGPMTRAVFEYWGVKKTEDFGEIVFNMIDVGVMSKTEQDTKDDFKEVYDFEEVFDKSYKFSLKNLEL
jgi:uncharacterized repeat protein (TIGR04138 family)